MPNLLKKNAMETKEPGILSEKIIKLLDLHKMSASELAKDLKVPYNRISRLLSGSISDPRVSTLQQIAAYFGVSLDYLIDQEIKTSNNGTTIPILDWESLQNNHIEKIIQDSSRSLSVAQIDKDISPDSLFALESTKSMNPRFPQGTTFILSSKEKPIDGDLVLVRFKKDSSVFLRELIIDSPDWILNSIIRDSIPLILDHTKHQILATVILTLINTRGS